MLQVIVAALKALPLLVEAIRDLGDLYHKIQISIIEKRYEEMRRDVDLITEEISNGKHSNEQRKDLVRRLNNAIRK